MLPDKPISCGGSKLRAKHKMHHRWHCASPNLPSIDNRLFVCLPPCSKYRSLLRSPKSRRHSSAIAPMRERERERESIGERESPPPSCSCSALSGEDSLCTWGKEEPLPMLRWRRRRGQAGTSVAWRRSPPPHCAHRRPSPDVFVGKEGEWRLRARQSHLLLWRLRAWQPHGLWAAATAASSTWSSKLGADEPPSATPSSASVSFPPSWERRRSAAPPRAFASTSHPA
jgi:hypothetical protein